MPYKETADRHEETRRPVAAFGLRVSSRTLDGELHTRVRSFPLRAQVSRFFLINAHLLIRYASSVYPLIDPAPHFAGKTYKEKVVIITGGSAGIGATAASFYAKAGANVLIIARRLEKLEQCKKDIEKEVPGAHVLVMAGDISDPEVGKRAVKMAVDAYGKVDIVLANQFSIIGGPVGSMSRLSLDH